MGQREDHLARQAALQQALGQSLAASSDLSDGDKAFLEKVIYGRWRELEASTGSLGQDEKLRLANLSFDGAPAIVHAARLGMTGSIIALRELGAKVDAKDREQKTAVRAAIEGDWPDAAEILCIPKSQTGKAPPAANIDIPDVHGVTPRMLAEEIVAHKRPVLGNYTVQIMRRILRAQP